MARTIAVLAVTQLIGWGTTFDMLGVLGRVIAPDLGVANEVAFLGISVMMVVSAFAGPLTGRLLVRFGASRVLAAGSVVFAAGLVLLAASTGIVLYAMAWCVIGVGAALGLSAPAYTAVVEREGANSSRTITILLLFTGLSSAVFWPLLSHAHSVWGWRATFLACAAAHILICLPLHLFALGRPVAVPQHENSEEDAPPVALSQAERRRAFLLIAAATTIATFVTYGLTPSLLQMLSLFGATPAFALQLGSLRGVMGISARFVDMLAGRRGNPLISATFGALLLVVAFLVPMLFGGSSAALVAFVVFYGFGSGVITVARALLPLAVFSRRYFGLQSARLTLPQNMASALAPVVFTGLLDRAGPDWVLVVCAVLSLSSLVFVALLTRMVIRSRRET